MRGSLVASRSLPQISHAVSTRSGLGRFRKVIQILELPFLFAVIRRNPTVLALSPNSVTLTKSGTPQLSPKVAKGGVLPGQKPLVNTDFAQTEPTSNRERPKSWTARWEIMSENVAMAQLKEARRLYRSAGPESSRRMSWGLVRISQRCLNHASGDKSLRVKCFDTVMNLASRSQKYGMQGNRCNEYRICFVSTNSV